MFGSIICALIFWAFFGELMIALTLAVIVFIVRAFQVLWKPALFSMAILFIIAQSSQPRAPSVQASSHIATGQYVDFSQHSQNP